MSGSAVVALLDTGVDGTHADLAGQLVPGTSILDGSDGTTDPNGHGTAMAGIIAALTDNGQGIAGIGYAGVKVMPITVLDANGEGSDSDIIQGVVWAVQHGADVINMSFSNPGYSAALQAAIDYAWAHNVVVVAATGNDGSSTVTFPAGDRGVIGVSNTDQNDGLNGSSNYGADTFLGAPGTDILTLAAGGGTDVGDRHVGLFGRGRRGGCAPARLGSVGLERGHRRAAGPDGRCGRDGRSDREWPAESRAGLRGHVDWVRGAGRGCSFGEWRADRGAVCGGFERDGLRNRSETRSRSFRFQG